MEFQASIKCDSERGEVAESRGQIFEDMYSNAYYLHQLELGT